MLFGRNLGMTINDLGAEKDSKTDLFFPLDSILKLNLFLGEGYLKFISSRETP